MSSNVIDTVVVVCLVPRAGVGVSLDKGAEWEIPVAKAARLIAHGQVRLLDKAEVKRLPTYVRPVKPADVAPAVAPAVSAGDDDEFDETDAVNVAEAVATPPEASTALGKAKAKKSAATKKPA